MKVQVIVINEHRLIREAIINLLSSSNNFAVNYSFKSMEEAIKRVHFMEFHTILVSLNRPLKQVSSFIHEIKQQKSWVKIIGISDPSDLMFNKSLLTTGIDAIISKNATKQELFSGIKASLNDNFFLSSELLDSMVELTIKQNKIEAIHSITKREHEVIGHIANGLTSQNIAKQIQVSVKTIESHRRNIFKKLNVKNSAELIKIALEQGIILDQHKTNL